MLRKALAVGIFSAGTACAAGPDGATGGSFFDPFDTLDAGRWYIGDYAAHGDWQNCSFLRRNARIRAGHLVLTFDKHPAYTRDFACASVSTRARFGYGTYEARLKTEAASGLNMNFFSYIGPYYDQPHDEIDFEVLTRDPGQVEVTAWVDGTALHSAKVPVEPPSDTAFATYSFIWTPERIQWFVNGALLFETNDPARQPRTAQIIFLSIWGTDTLTDWMGPFYGGETPRAMEVDWVSYTAPGDRCIHAGSILCD